MKKRGFPALMLLASLALLCACGGGTPNLTISPNWYSYTAQDSISNTYERLEYAISFKSDAAADEYRVEYETENATYVTVLENVDEEVYKLTTERHIAGKFCYGPSESGRFEDSTKSEVLFHKAGNGLRPIQSTCEFHTTIPVNDPSPDKLCEQRDYTYTITYADDLKSAHFIQKDLNEKAKPIEQDIEIDIEGSFLDNEQIVFALRGVDLGSSVAFHTIDPQTRTVVPVALGEVTATTGDYPALGNQVSTNEVKIGYTNEHPGPTRTVVYAAKGEKDNNQYRNVPISFQNVLPYSLGTLTYTLKTANFTA